MSIKQPKDLKFSQHGVSASFTWPKNFATDHNNRVEYAQMARDVAFMTQVSSYMPHGNETGAGGFIKRTQIYNAFLAGTGEVGFPGPTARFLNEGLVMEGANSGNAWADKGEKKVVREPEEKLQFHGAPKRGAHWCERMWADKGKEIDKITEDAYKKGGK